MDLQETFSQLDREIESIEAANAERTIQIKDLTEKNEQGETRIGDLKAAKLAVETALQRLRDVGPLLGAGTPVALAATTAQKESKERKRAPHLKKYVLPMLDEAGPLGMLPEEIISHLQSKHGIAVAVTTMKPLLFKLKKDGKAEQTAEKRWRDPANGSRRGGTHHDHQHAAAAD